MRKVMGGVALLWLVMWTQTAFAGMEGWSGNLNASFGTSVLEEDDWEALHQPATLGLAVDLKYETWPVSIVLGYRMSQDEKDDEDDFHTEMKLSEISLGVRKVVDRWPWIRPFIGGGLSSVSASFSSQFTESDPDETVVESDSDRVEGVWLDGGAYITVAEHLNIGFDVRFSRARAILFDTDTDASTLYYGLLIGYHW